MNHDLPISIALVDDHCLFRNGLARLIQSRKTFKVSIEASDGSDLLSQLEYSGKLPDICILDIEMKPMNGYETALILSEKYPSIKIMALSMHNDEYCKVNMIKNGAKGFITKDANPNIFLESLQHLNEKGYYYNDLSPQTITNALLPTTDSKFLIQTREREFLAYCCSDMQYKDIAKQMNVSIRTIDSYRDSLFKKLDIKTRSGLIMFAMLNGLNTIIN